MQCGKCRVKAAKNAVWKMVCLFVFEAFCFRSGILRGIPPKLISHCPSQLNSSIIHAVYGEE
jgi:hypothetical protein